MVKTVHAASVAAAKALRLTTTGSQIKLEKVSIIPREKQSTPDQRPSGPSAVACLKIHSKRVEKM
jgi:hypothetical protein